MQHLMDLFDWRVEEVLPLVLVIAQTLVVDEVVQGLVLPAWSELLYDLPEALVDLVVLADVNGVAEYDPRVVHVVRGSFLLQ